MIPDNVLSAIPVRSSFLVPERDSLFVDYAIHPESKKLMVCNYSPEGVVTYTHQGQVTTVIAITGITALSFALDLNLRPTLVYVKNNSTFMYWFNSAIGKMDTTEWGVNYKFPQLALDETRIENSTQADVIFAYIRDNKLCIRNQHDRFTIQTILDDAPRLKQIGMLQNNRFGFNTYKRIKPKDM